MDSGKQYMSRVNLKSNQELSELAKKTCSEYSLGLPTKPPEIIEIGYEDFNFIIITEAGAFVVGM